MRFVPTLAAVAALLTTPVMAHEFKVGDIVVDHPYSFTTPTNARAGAGYLSITNNGTSEDRLLNVEAPFDRIEIHQTSVDANGVASMSPAEDGVIIGPGETVLLEPGGFHIMFMGLGGDPFEEDEKINATLTFEAAGTLDVVFNVETRGEKEPDVDHSAHGAAAETDHSGHGADHADEDHSNH